MYSVAWPDEDAQEQMHTETKLPRLTRKVACELPKSNPFLRHRRGDATSRSSLQYMIESLQ